MKQFLVKIITLCLMTHGLLYGEVQPEQLLGVSLSENGLVFQVSSAGCTTKDDFSFQVAVEHEQLSPMLPALEPHHYITVNRTSTDPCESPQPYGTRIEVSFDELNILAGKFHVKNPIGGDKIPITSEKHE